MDHYADLLETAAWYIRYTIKKLTLPIEEHGFYLNKTTFWDAIYMRYGWKPEKIPDKCVCSAQFSMEYTLTCPHGDLTFINHPPQNKKVNVLRA